ncbi:MAG: DNA polymerase [Bacillota bacterium]
MKYPKLQLKADFKNRLEKAESSKKERVKKTKEKVIQQIETIEEAWVRVLNMKNSEADKEKLLKVKFRMERGLIGRDPATASKKFSKAEALRLHKIIEDEERQAKLEQMVKETPDNYILVEDDDTFKLLLKEMDDNELLAVDCETFATNENESALDPWTGQMAGFTISSRNYHFYCPLRHTEETKLILERGEKFILERLKPRLEKPGKKLVLHNAPFDAKWFFVFHGIDFIDNIYLDTRVAAFMMDENRSHALKDLATDWLKIGSDKFSSLFTEGEFHKVPLKYAKAYGAKDGDLTIKVVDFCEHWLNKREDLKKIRELLYEVEMPVLRQMIRSDIRGIHFDPEEAVEVDKKLEEHEKAIEKEVKDMLGVGPEFNLGSPIQLSKKLFKDMKITDLKDGSTSSKVLKKIKSEHTVIPKILEYREVSKLRNSFTVKLPKEIKSDGKIHPWHNSLGAKTGRKTCSNPNSQQLPSMTKNPLIRPLFKPSKGFIFASIDFSQIELRVLAHVAQEEIMIRAFKEGKDLHSTTAARVFLSELPFDEGYARIEEFKDVDDKPEAKYRKQSKNVNFGAVYGITGKGLADMLGSSEAEANLIIRGYFAGYPGIKTYMDEQKLFLHRHGYVVDMFGRKRRLKDKLNGQWWETGSAERQSGNFGIQSAAGVILKIAIKHLKPVLEEIGGYILLSIHDELLFELPETVTKEQLYRLRDTMENVVKLTVPLRSDIEINPNAWGIKVSEEEFFKIA